MVKILCERTLQLDPNPDLVSVAIRYHLQTESQLLSVEDHLTFSPEPCRLNNSRSGPLDFIGSQNIKAAQNDVIVNWGFKAPAVMFQQADVFAAIIPQINLLSADQLRRKKRPYASWGTPPQGGEQRMKINLPHSIGGIRQIG